MRKRPNLDPSFLMKVEKMLGYNRHMQKSLQQAPIFRREILIPFEKQNLPAASKTAGRLAGSRKKLPARFQKLLAEPTPDV